MLGAERADRPSAQPEQPAVGGVKAKPAGGEHAEQVAVGDQGDVTVGKQRPDPGQRPVGPFADVLHGLPG